MDKAQELRDQRLVSKITVFHVFIVFGIKLLTSFFTRSVSFLTELGDSVLDFTFMAITVMALKESRKPADYKHLFGHYKINSVAGLFQSLLIIGLYFYIFYISIITLLDWQGYTTENGLLGVMALLVVLVFVFIDSSIIVRVGKRSNNPVIISQGANFRGDLYRNVTIIIGLIVSSFGIYILDPILAAFFSVISVIKGLKVLKQSFDELVDANVISQDILEEIETVIKEIPRIDQLDDLLVKTAGNKMDIRVFITVDKETSAFIGNDISTQIKTLFDKRFGDKYDLHTMVQLNITGSVNRDDVEFLFQVIRDIAKDQPSISNVHNISVNVFKDKIVVQCHLAMDPDMKLAIANETSTRLEQLIVAQLHELKRIDNVEVFTHMEPLHVVRKQHPHSIMQSVPLEIVQEIRDIITNFKDVKDIKKLDVFEEDQGFDVSTIVLIDGQMTLQHAHAIADRLYYILQAEVVGLKHCIIHTEPTQT